MLQHIIVGFLLISAARAMHLEYLKVDSDEKPLDDTLIGQDVDLHRSGMNLPGKCWMCKWAMKWLKKHIGNKDKAEAIKQKLHEVCDNIRIQKSLCKKIVTKNIDILTEELSTNDDPATICASINMCTPKPPPEFIQAFPEVQLIL
ncbi:antimicrobial peptide NK-lysin-like [Hoplias malabaricus]|uniref:antimicrobial peptide NK-lysin-like n=1 Tax=Hoplias malabaricus TaxID=27720 RepID=UPI0034626EFA